MRAPIYDQRVVRDSLFGVGIIFGKVVPAIFSLDVEKTRRAVVAQDFMTSIKYQEAKLIEVPVTETHSRVFSDDRKAFGVIGCAQDIKRAAIALGSITQAHRAVSERLTFAVCDGGGHCATRRCRHDDSLLLGH